MANILVTGSSRGLGLELVKQLATHPIPKGGLVVATARKCSSKLQEIILSAKGSVIFVSLDITDEGAIKHSAEEVGSALAGRNLDILINCAGVHSETHEGVAHMYEPPASFLLLPQSVPGPKTQLRNVLGPISNTIFRLT